MVELDGMDRMADNVIGAFGGELPDKAKAPLLWSITNWLTIAKIAGLAPCQPEEWIAIEYSLLRMRRYDLLYAMIIYQILQDGGSGDWEADVCTSLKLLMLDGPPADSLESLCWCIAHKEVISPVIHLRQITQEGYETLFLYLMTQKRYDLLFFAMVQDTIMKKGLGEDLLRPRGGGDD